jgi:hypothetical protein
MIRQLFRFYTPMKFAWRFDDRSPFPLFPTNERIKPDFDSLSLGFKQSYIALLESIKDLDIDHISSFSADPLFRSLQESFLILSNRKYSLELLNKEFINDLQIDFFNVKVNIAVPKTTALYIDKSLDIQEQMFDKGNVKIWKFDRRSVTVEEAEEEYFASLKVDVLFTGPAKFMMLDENREVVMGNSSQMPESHLVEYEVRKSIKLNKIFQGWAAFYQLTMMLGEGTTFFKDCHWTVVDIDNHLRNLKNE